MQYTPSCCPSSSHIVCAQPVHMSRATPHNDVVFVANTRYLAVCTSSLLFSVKEEIDRAHREDGSCRSTIFLDEALKRLQEAHEQLQRNIQQHTFSFFPDPINNPISSAQPIHVTLRRQTAARELERKIQECLAIKQAHPSTYMLSCDTVPPPVPCEQTSATAAPMTTCTPPPNPHPHLLHQAVPLSCCLEQPYTVPPPPPQQFHYSLAYTTTTPVEQSEESNNNNDDYTTAEESDESASSWQQSDNDSDDNNDNDSAYRPSCINLTPPTTTNHRSTRKQRPHETTKRIPRVICRQSPPRPVHGRSTTRYQLRPLRHMPRYTITRNVYQ